LQDDDKILLGTGDDLEIYHDGSNSYISDTGTGDLIITATTFRPRTDHWIVANAANSENLLQAVADGAVTLYHNGLAKLATASGGVNVTGTLTATTLTGTLATAAQTNITSLGTLTALTLSGNLDLGDDDYIRLGTGNDLQIYHSGTQSYIKDAGTGDLYIDSPAALRCLTAQFQLNNAANNEAMIQALEDGAVTLYHDGAAKLATQSDGITVTGNIHSGSGDIRIQSAADENMAIFNPDGSVQLQYDNSTKFATASGGVDVTGDLDVSGELDVVGQAKFGGGTTISTSGEVKVEAGGKYTVVDGNDLNIVYPSGRSVFFKEGGTTAMTIDNANNVGIGTTGPAAELNVVGGTLLAQSTTLSPADPIKSTTMLQVHGDAIGAGVVDVDFFKGFKIGLNDGPEYGGQAQFSVGRWEDSGSEARSSLVMSLGHGSLAPDTDADVDVMTLLSSGYVGIGTTSPDAHLEISAADNAPTLKFSESDDTNKMLLKFASDIGELTVVPDKVLNFKNNNTTRMSIAVGGAVNVAGAFSKGSGSFRIDHPLPEKKDTHHLVHSFIEGPKADLIYRGTVDLSGGYAQVDLDDAAGMTEGTWELLCRDPQCWIQNDTGWSAVRGDVEGNTLTIECETTDSDDTVSWMVVAERCDPHMYETGWTDDDGHVIVEPEKPEEEE